MNCMRCHGPMKKAERDGILIDVCPDCKGIWLDGGELDMLQKGERKEVKEILQEAREEILEERSRILQISGMCLKCQKSHVQAVQRAGVELDICPSCHGAFFDSGELEQLRARKNKSFKSVLTEFLFRS